MAVVLSISDREYFGYRTGIYYLCFYAETPFSVRIHADEAPFEDKFDYWDEKVLTRVVGPKYFSYGRYFNSFFGRPGTIYIYTEAEEVPVGTEPPTIFYRVCKETNYTTQNAR